MHHPGPPLFGATGDEFELAPRDPDPEATYTWELVDQPDGSSVALGDDPVESLVPDAPGTYVARLNAPDGEHDLTVRAFPESLSPHGGAGVSGVADDADAGGRSGDESEVYTQVEREGDGTTGRPRLELVPSVEDGEAVVRADLRPHPGGVETAADLDVEFLLDDRDDVAPDAVTRSGRELRMPVDALDDRTRVHAVAIGAHGYSVPDAATFERTTAGVEATRPYDPPAWAEDATIYEIYVRTFADGDAEEGSVFDAIVERLDYIDSLGVDAIWLTPVLQHDGAPHGYNITDFFAIASDLGERDDYERFVEAAHDRDIKVLFDLVCNHSARDHPYFKDARQGPGSTYREWYEWTASGEPGTYFGWEFIANFNFENLRVRRHLLDAAAEWAPLVDGFRCDMAWAVPNGFWRELHDRCKDRERDFLLLDETIPYIPDFQAGLFDMHFDSYTYYVLRQVGSGADAERVFDAVESRADIGFPDHAAFMLYTENHDETRYLVECGRPAAEAALGAVFTLPGAPLVYAGQEFGQRGKRDALAWEHADEALRAHVRSLATVRDDVPALAADAAFVRVPYTVTAGDEGRVVAYARSTGAEAVVVVLNFGADPATVDVPAVAEATDLVSGESVAATTADGVTVDSVAVLPATVTDAD